MSTVLDFPSTNPPGYDSRPDEPTHCWDLSQLGDIPTRSLRSVADLGYAPGLAQSLGSELAISQPVRVLTSDDAEHLRRIVEDLRVHAIHDGADPRRSILRGCVYRSTNLRALLSDTELLDHVSRSVGYEVGPGTVPHQMAHVNVFDPHPDGATPSRREPADTGAWHIDQNAVVLILSLGGMDDPDGGAFQFFDGTREEGLTMLARDGAIPPERCVDIALPFGWGVVAHGAYLLHRSAPMQPGPVRVSVVSAFEPLDPARQDLGPTAFVPDGYGNDENGLTERRVRSVEYARHKAWRLRNKLDAFLSADAWDSSDDDLVAALAQCMSEGLECARVLRGGEIDPKEALVQYLNATRP